MAAVSVKRSIDLHWEIEAYTLKRSNAIRLDSEHNVYCGCLKKKIKRKIDVASV